MAAKSIDDVKKAAAAVQDEEDDPNEDEMPTPEEMAVSANAIAKAYQQIDAAEQSGKLSKDDADLMRGRVDAFKAQYRHELHRQNDGMAPPVTQAGIDAASPPDDQKMPSMFHPPMAAWHPPMHPSYNPYFNNPANKGH